MKAVNYRMTEKELGILRYITEHTEYSINSFIRFAVESQMEEGLRLAKRRHGEKLKRGY